MWQRILAITIARNREFYRDSAGLIWNILMPAMAILAFAFIFSDEPKALLKIAVLETVGETQLEESPLSDLLAIPALEVIPVPNTDSQQAVAKIQRHQLDLLIDPASLAYWVNPESPNGQIAERLLLGSAALAGQDNGGGPQRRIADGEALSYADWVVPGVLAMNLMFSSLWGVGWVLVRYRKNGVLRRYKATPLRPIEFLIAQVLSRLMVVIGSSSIVYLGALALLDFPMRGSYLALALIFIAGALCMISIGLMVASRLRTEELADGLLNLFSWPMLLLSGVWFSMEGASTLAQTASHLMPLKYLVDGARAVMIDGAGVIEILPHLLVLLSLAVVLLGLATRLFKWE